MTCGRVAVAGCRGRMGAMLLRKMKAAGIDASGVDRPFSSKEAGEGVSGAGIVVLCVPAACTGEVVGELAPRLSPDAIVADIASVKERPLAAMLRGWSGPVVGTHPLFGPNPKEKELSVALVPGRGDAAATKVEALFRLLGWRVFRTTARVHDEAMARIQGLNFLTEAAYFGMLAGDGRLMPFLTPSFRRRFAAARKLLMDDGPLFAGLVAENPHMREALRGYREALSGETPGELDVLLSQACSWDRKLTAKEGEL